MKRSLSSVSGLVVLASVSLVSSASAVVSIDYVTVGNAGNAADTADGDSSTSGVQRYGAVAYKYKIAKNETTIGQYAEFLNVAAKSDPYALYSTNMTSGWINGISRSGSSGSYRYTVNPGSANKPITFVTWFDAARMCNWLHNGQGSGSTERGAYTLNGAMSGIYTKNVGATVWIPSENEWYKAAYYDATKGGTGGYWKYPTQSNVLGGNTIGVPNSANYYDGDYVGSGSSALPPSNALTDVGAYGGNSDSFYGTNDQGGNVYEWNDAVDLGSFRGERGGSWYNAGPNAPFLVSSDRGVSAPSNESFFTGFRVASVAEQGPVGADFRITSVSVMSGGSQVQLTWGSEPSATYSIESSLDLTTLSWTGMATGILSQGSSTTHTLDITSGPRRFFRVVKQP